MTGSHLRRRTRPHRGLSRRRRPALERADKGMHSTSKGGSEMDNSLPQTEGATPSRADGAISKVEIPQYRRRAIFAVWAAAALPMAALAWLVAPALEDQFGGEANVPLVKALLICLTLGLIWQFVLVAVLVRREQRTLQWS